MAGDIHLSVRPGHLLVVLIVVSGWIVVSKNFQDGLNFFVAGIILCLAWAFFELAFDEQRKLRGIHHRF